MVTIGSLPVSTTGKLPLSSKASQADEQLLFDPQTLSTAQVSSNLDVSCSALGGAVCTIAPKLPTPGTIVTDLIGSLSLLATTA